MDAVPEVPKNDLPSSLRRMSPVVADVFSDMLALFYEATVKIHKQLTVFKWHRIAVVHIFNKLHQAISQLNNLHVGNRISRQER